MLLFHSVAYFIIWLLVFLELVLGGYFLFVCLYIKTPIFCQIQLVKFCFVLFIFCRLEFHSVMISFTLQNSLTFTRLHFSVIFFSNWILLRKFLPAPLNFRVLLLSSLSGFRQQVLYWSPLIHLGLSSAQGKRLRPIFIHVCGYSICSMSLVEAAFLSPKI
jgi:hypothetical protein